MDNQCLVLLSKFSVAARKVIGSINSAKLIRDNQYAKEIFQQVDEMGDEELILLSLDLQNTLGLLGSTLTDEAPVIEKKYVYGARG